MRKPGGGAWWDCGPSFRVSNCVLVGKGALGVVAGVLEWWMGGLIGRIIKFVFWIEPNCAGGAVGNRGTGLRE